MSNLCIVCNCDSCNKNGCLTCFDFNNFELKIDEYVVTSSSMQYLVIDNDMSKATKKQTALKSKRYKGKANKKLKTFQNKKK